MVLLEARFFMDQNRRENALTLPPNPAPFSPSLFSGFLPPLWFIPAFFFFFYLYITEVTLVVAIPRTCLFRADFV